MRSIIAILFGLGLLLASCTATDSITPESVKAEIQKDCGIITTVADIAALITANPAIGSASAFAKLVCGAFASQKSAGSGDARRGGGVLDVGGVPIHYTVN